MLQQFKVSLKSLKHLADTCGTTTFAIANAKKERRYMPGTEDKRTPVPTTEPARHQHLKT